MPEVEDEKVTSEKLKLHVTDMGSYHPSGPGTPTQDISLRTDMTLRKPVSSAETQTSLEGHLYHLTHIKKKSHR